ncbi:MAG: glycosyltransferase [Patescibacteria group bacterium]
MKSLYIIFNAQVDKNSMGGGDKIVMNVSRVLRDKKLCNLKYLGCPEGIEMVKKNIENIDSSYLNSFEVKTLSLVGAYFLRILFSFNIFFSNIKKQGVNEEINDRDTVLWSASDFLPDTFPCFLYKLFNPNIKWIGSIFLRSRNPFKKEVEFTYRTFLSFVSQQISVFLFKLCCDYVCVLCKDDIDYLVSKGLSKDKIFITSGGVDTKEFDKVSVNEKKYDACFVGRFHAQKGLNDLIYVWKKIVEGRKANIGSESYNGKLAIVGWGDEKQIGDLKKLIRENGIEKNVDLKGFLDGEEKIEVIKSSKILLFPSSFESWGVVIAEGIASGVPVVSYKLPTIYEDFKFGVVWVEPFDKDLYFSEVKKLLEDESYRDNIVNKARSFVKELDWESVGLKFSKYI